VTLAEPFSEPGVSDGTWKAAKGRLRLTAGRRMALDGYRRAVKGCSLALEWAAGMRRAVPAVAGAALISAGIGLRFGAWAGLIVAGAFCLRLDSRL